MSPTEQILGRVRDALKAVERRSAGGAFAAMSAAVLVAGFAGALLVARMGTPRTRAIAISLAFGCVFLLSILGLARVIHWRNAKAAIRQEVRETDEVLAGAIDRAVTLLERSEVEAEEARDDGVRDALQLSELHLSRQLGRISFPQIADRAARRGRALGVLAALVAAAAVAMIAIEPIRLVEGADVLAARRGVAPVALIYLDDVDLVSTPPSYLQQPERDLEDFGVTKAPRGSVITLRGKPIRPGRALVVTDGVREVPFEADGSGTVVARWTLADSATLRIAARFGKVLVPQGDKLSVQSIPDEAPVVKVEGAPKTVRLIETPSVALKYEATDDHGLREIQLVLRSGKDVERRTLARPSADTKTARGGEEVSTSEPFFKKSFLPVEVTIEARDNDAVLGPKWGKSPAIVVVPPAVGEPEARRYAALLEIRDALVDLAAPRVTYDTHQLKNGAEVAKTEADAQRAADVAIEDIVASVHGGLSIHGPVRTVIAGQLRRLDKAVAAFRDKPVADQYAKLVTASEDAALAVDSAVRAQGFRDAVTVAKKLSLVAASVGETARGYDKDPDRQSADQRLDATIGVLDAGGKELVKLGDLGFDLGDVVRGGVGRITRPRTAGDMLHTEIAAYDLAERLKRADASLGGGGRAGVESGGTPSGGSADEGDASEAESDAESNGQELDQLIKHHAEEIAKVAQAMKNANTPEEREALKKLAKEQADSIRDAVKDLPEHGGDGTPSGKAAEGKKHAEAMASELEQGNLDEAVQRGTEALSKLKDAAQLGKDSPFSDDNDLGNDATRSGNRIDEALEALKNAQEKMKDAAKQRAKDDLSSAGEDEKRLGQRTHDVRDRSEKGSAPMPQDKLDKLEEAERAMKEAAKALKEGDAPKGTAAQQEAQRLLEMARSEDDSDEQSESSKGGDGASEGKRMSQDTKVPEKDKPKAPEDFQKRVTDGLGMPQDPRLRDAIKRYAEGLLR